MIVTNTVRNRVKNEHKQNSDPITDSNSNPISNPNSNHGLWKKDQGWKKDLMLMFHSDPVSLIAVED